MMDPAAVTIVDTEEGAAAHGSTNKSQHNAVFCAWLCRVYGQDYLRTKRGVADVAGGQVIFPCIHTDRYLTLLIIHRAI